MHTQLPAPRLCVAEPQQPRARQQQPREHQRPGLRHVAAKRGHAVHEQLARGLAVAVGRAALAKPRARRHRLHVRGEAAQ
ncbi:hypothetical protein BBAD15_g10833 [Beauveria bassiana D1-5]|uniref:Uncharacterized protein n=1 Tax=Beauveria bassiana D1-5 TaxID=1245745 RepID=A0A0A2VCU7_BEABA|nr:hypothetical protein BBAD15_g10833 [Beauveria bassiana D1-5]